MTTPGWTQALETADLTVWLADDVPLMFRRLPKVEQDDDGDSFWMGSRGYWASEEPRHRVRIRRSFYMGVFPVTQHQWRAIGAEFATELDAAPSHFDGDFHPVEQVSWHDAVAWCQAVQASGLLQDATDREGTVLANPHVCLPSEAQWEYACRAGTDTEYYTGDGEAALAEVGWYDGNSASSTQPVGLLAPNGFGLYDMHGNVWEWCRDAWDEHVYKRRVDGVCDPEVRGDEDVDRVIRGGSWYYPPRDCGAAYRFWWRPSDRFWYLGFRVCLFSGPCPDRQEAEPPSGGVARR